MLAAVLLLGGLAALFALLLGLSEYYLPSDKNSLSEQINRLLPQTQCAQCGHPGCRPYAEAIANGKADINQCPPGGDVTIVALAKLLGREAKALDSSFGVTKELSVAVIDEDNCIGCTLCIQACPVDAILGAAQKMHSVISDECTGCELCIPPCPVDCIDMQTVEMLNTPELTIRTNLA